MILSHQDETQHFHRYIKARLPDVIPKYVKVTCKDIEIVKMEVERDSRNRTYVFVLQMRTDKGTGICELSVAESEIKHEQIRVQNGFVWVVEEFLKRVPGAAVEASGCPPGYIVVWEEDNTRFLCI